MKALSLFFVSLIILASIANAEVPEMINYQGFLTGPPPANNPITGTVSITFSIWDQASDGTSLWIETHPSVEVERGIFEVLLGIVDPVGNPLDLSIFDHPNRWLEIQVDGDPPIDIRSRFGSTPYTYQAARADIADLAESGGGWVDEGSVVVLQTSTDSVGIGTATPSARLEVNENIAWIDRAAIRVTNTNAANNNGKAFEVYHDDKSRCEIFPSGNITLYDTDNSVSVHLCTEGPSTAYFKRNVGIGTITPDEKLTVDGNVHVAGDMIVDGIISSTAGCRIIAGTYTGDGSGSRQIYLGIRPKFVIIGADCGITQVWGAIFDGYAIEDRGETNENKNRTSVAQPYDNGFTVGTSAGADGFNGTGAIYHYVVFY